MKVLNKLETLLGPTIPDKVWLPTCQKIVFTLSIQEETQLSEYSYLEGDLLVLLPSLDVYQKWAEGVSLNTDVEEITFSSARDLSKEIASLGLVIVNENFDIQNIHWVR